MTRFLDAYFRTLGLGPGMFFVAFVGTSIVGITIVWAVKSYLGGA